MGSVFFWVTLYYKLRNKDGEGGVQYYLITNHFSHISFY